MRENFERKFRTEGPTYTAVRDLVTKFREPDLCMMAAEMDAQVNLGKEPNWFEKHLKKIRSYLLVRHLTC